MTHTPDPQIQPPLLDKPEIERRNEAALLEDLFTGRLEFRSRPREIELQLSNFCNMSCTMCYDGDNPPLRKLPEQIVAHVEEEVLPTASVLVPGSGTEPLILTWEETRRLADTHGMEIYIVTNLQFLDEQRFRELEPHVAMVVFSVDSHIPGIYERIRLRSKPEKVFANLPRAAALCAEAGIEVQANIVFMVENAPYIDETVAYLADAGVHTVRLLRFVPLMTGNQFLDAEQHLSAEWLTWKKQQIRDVAKDKQIRVIFDLSDKEVIDHLPIDLELRSSRKYPEWFERLRYFYPGYCNQVASSVKVDTEGQVYPCCVASQDNLLMGDLRFQSFGEIWNGKPMQRLRKQMMSGDEPEYCKSCAHRPHHFVDPTEHLPFVIQVVDEHLAGRQVIDPKLGIRGPAHLARLHEPPRFHIEPVPEASGYLLVLAIGGEQHPTNQFIELPGDCRDYQLDRAIWRQLQPDVAWWWSIWALTPNGGRRRPQLTCLRRLQAADS